jgi:hypothetical protein
MKFLKWFLKESWFHIIWILGLITYVLTWSYGSDKNLALIFLSSVFVTLTLGKFRYWYKNLKNNG